MNSLKQCIDVWKMFAIVFTLISETHSCNFCELFRTLVQGICLLPFSSLRMDLTKVEASENSVASDLTVQTLKQLFITLHAGQLLKIVQIL